MISTQRHLQALILVVGAWCASAQFAKDISWTPTIKKSLVSAMESAVAAGDGGGQDEFFRNSGVVVKGNNYWGVNGVHPQECTDRLSCAYPKSIIKGTIEPDALVERYPFDASSATQWGITDVDMEGLTFGADGGETYLYVGDEYNNLYQVDIASGSLVRAWKLGDLFSITGVPADKGIESLAYDADADHFYVGIQETSIVYCFTLDPAEACPSSGCVGVSLVTSWEAEESPSGMFYYPAQQALYVLCGTRTNGDQYIFKYSNSATGSPTKDCKITIPAAVGLARTDGFFIDDSTSSAYIVDSQGPMHTQALGYNLFQVEWNDPCGDDGTATPAPATTATPAPSTPATPAPAAAATPAPATPATPAPAAAPTAAPTPAITPDPTSAAAAYRHGKAAMLLAAALALVA